MNYDDGCCRLPAYCSVENGRCLLKENWELANKRHPEPREPAPEIGAEAVRQRIENGRVPHEETCEERRARIKKQAMERVAWERRQPGYDLGRTR